MPVNPDRCDPSRPDEGSPTGRLSESRPELQDFPGAAEKREAILRGIKFLSVLFETIKEAGPEGAPEGSMYLAVMMAGFSLEAFEGALALLAKRGLIRRSGHVAYYVPPPDKIEAGLGPEENH